MVSALSVMNELRKERRLVLHLNLVFSSFKLPCSNYGANIISLM
jgi:hypothetical protein